jgi:hypothetical protein
VRTNLSKGLGFSKEDRDINIRRIGFVCTLLTRNDVVAIAADVDTIRPPCIFEWQMGAGLWHVAVVAAGAGRGGKLTVRPQQGVDVGVGAPGKAGVMRVTGGAVGLIIDARGRPLVLPRDEGRRRELNQKWLYDIGALQ